MVVFITGTKQNSLLYIDDGLEKYIDRLNGENHGIIVFYTLKLVDSSEIKNQDFQFVYACA